MDDLVRFEKYCCLLAHDIVLTDYSSIPKLDILAVVLRNGDLVLYGLRHEDPHPIIKWIPWFDDISKKICALSFGPGGKELLLACFDHSFYIVPARTLLAIPSDGKNDSCTLDHDALKLPCPFLGDEGFIPSAIAWWVADGQAAGDSPRHTAIVGSTNGLIIAFTIYTGAVVFIINVEGFISKIDVISKTESVVVVTTSIGKQWRIKLKSSKGTSSLVEGSISAFSARSINVVDGKPEAKKMQCLQNFFPAHVDLITKDRIIYRKDANLKINMETVEKSMLYFSRNSEVSLFSGGMVTALGGVDPNVDSLDNLIPQFFIIPDKTHFYGTTDSFFVLGSEEMDSIHIVSKHLASTTSEQNKGFNPDALMQVIKLLENERVLDMHSSRRRDQGFIVTTNGVYVLRTTKNPHDLFVDAISADGNLQKVEKLNTIFGQYSCVLIIRAASIKLAQGLVEEAKHLYSVLRVYGVSTHEIANFATMGYFQDLGRLILDCKNLKVGPATAARVTNLKLLMSIYRIFLNPDDNQMAQALREFLVSKAKDEMFAIRTLCQVDLFSELHFLMVMKGLHQSVLPALMTLDFTLDVAHMASFWEIISDPSLTETLISRQVFATFHISLVQKYLTTLPLEIVQNLEKLYNPYQTTVRNFISNICKGDLPRKLWVETYISICVFLSSFIVEFDENTLSMTSYGHVWEVEQPRLPYVPQVMTAGFKHASAVFKGVAYVWGSSDSGCLGFGPTEQPVGGPGSVDTLLNLRKTVIAISCGGHHTIALTNDGVYTWGSNTYGQLGIGNAVLAWHPTRIEILSSFRVISICAGQYHSMALDDSNRVFSWGWGVHGQLGHGDVEDVYRPKIITSLSDKGICSFSAGLAHSLFLDIEGNVWACGNNTFGQLGSKEMKKSSKPIQVYMFAQRICYIEAGYFQNYALGTDGKLFQWGRSATQLRSAAISAKRRVRLEDYVKHQATFDSEYMVPKLVRVSSVQGRIIKVCVGNEHSIALTDKGSVYAWGSNTDGQLGIIIQNFQTVPSPVPIPIDAKIVNIACGWNFTVALDDAGKVWTWGAIQNVKVGTGTKLDRLEGEIVVVNNKNRVIKSPHSNSCIHPVPTVLIINHQNKEQEMYSPAKLPSPLINSQWRMRMHFTLEQLLNYYDPQIILQQCLKMKEHCACSKLALLSGDYATSVTEKLLTTKNEDEKIAVLNFYLTVDCTDTDALKKMLTSIIQFWTERKMDFKNLEKVFLNHENKIALPLGILLFGMSSGSSDCSSLFTTSFKVNLVKKIISLRSDESECIFDGFSSTSDVIKALESVDEFIDIDFIQIKDASTGLEERRFFSV